MTTPNPTPKIKLLGYRVLVMLAKLESNIELPEGSEIDPLRGTIIQLGDGRINWQGDKAPFSVAVGDEVLLSSLATFNYFENGVDYRIVNGEDIVGVLNRP